MFVLLFLWVLDIALDTVSIPGWAYLAGILVGLVSWIANAVISNQ